MKLNAKRFLFLGVFFLLAGLTAFFRFPFCLQSSLNDLFSVQIDGTALPKEITDKYANVLNVVVEGDSFEETQQKADDFAKNISDAGIKNITYHFQNDILNQSIDYLKDHQNSFLSDKTRQLLKANQSNLVRQNATEQIQSSWIPLIVPLKQDAFLLLSDYIQSIERPSLTWQEKNGVLWQEKGGKNYIYLFIKMDPSNINQMINEIRTIILLSDTNIHLSGAPLHTVQMFNQTKKDITLISVLAFLMLFVLTYLLFNNVRSILLVRLNLGVAFLCGTLSVFLFSPSVHFLTFAFGASLVGICIDYTYHRFYCSDDKKALFQNIFYSFLTTICCFGVLLFSDFALLKQIALFTIGGLCGTFAWVFICPAITNTKKTPIKMFEIPFKKTFFVIFIILCVIGLAKTNINHSPQNLYKPTEELQKQENFFISLNGENFSHLLIIQGNDLEEVLQKEEKIKEDFNFFSVSSLLPSQKRQTENARLIQKLYEKQASTLQADLGLKQSPNFKTTPIATQKDFQDKFPLLMQQFIVQTKSGMWSIIPLSNTPKINQTGVFVFKPSSFLSDQLDLQAQKTYQTLLICFVFLFILLCFIYKKSAFKYLFPSVLAVIGTIGILSLLGQPITFFHFLSLFIVIGLSMDYTIFLFNKKGDYFKPVLFSFLSSFIGFGLLSFVHFYLVAVMGQTIALGLLLSFCLTLMLRRKE